MTIENIWKGLKMKGAKTAIEITIENYNKAIKRLDRIYWVSLLLSMLVAFILPALKNYGIVLSIAYMLVGVTLGNLGKLREKRNFMVKKLQQLEYAGIHGDHIS